MSKKRALVRKIKKEDIDFVIKNIREADKREIEDASGLNYKDCLNRIYAMNDNAWTGLADGEIVAIFGVQMASYITGNGIPWMISTKGIEKHAILFTRHCKPVFKMMVKDCKTLMNFVDDRNNLAKMWLKWLGFKLEESQPYGAKQLPFRLFKMNLEK